MRRNAVIVAVLVFGLVLAWALPPVQGARGIAGYLPLHMLLETVAIVIAMLVFAVGWNAYSDKLPGNIVLLACAFLGVGLLDFSHVLSYAGMPDFVTPSNPEKAIDFWLAARALAAAALLTVAIAPWQPFASAATRYLLLAAVLAITAVMHWLILFHQDALPPTFVLGQGLTALKIGTEYELVTLNLAAAAVLLMRMRKPQPFNAAALFGAVCAMALSEFFFTLYADVTDLFNLLGHIYKAISYLFIYHAIFVATVVRPYRQLSASQAQLQATHDALPDLLFELDLAGRYYDYHAPRTEQPNSYPEAFHRKMLHDTLPADAVQTIIAALQEADSSGYSRGEYELESPQGKRCFEFSVARKPAELGQEAHFIVLSRDTSERKAAEEQIHALAYYDGLTNLPNRRLLTERLRQSFLVSARSEQYGTVLLLDLDQFKTLNETKGYDIGNLLLIEVARRLKANVSEGDTVARIGSDEFIVILEALSHNAEEAAAQASYFAEKLQAALSQSYQLRDYTYHLTPSIGIAMFRDHEEDLEELLQHAEVAMQQAKSAGRNTIRFHDQHMQAALEARAELEGELRLALDRKQFQLYYQIQVDSLGRALGAEALIRWIHPVRGMVSPLQFIPLAEETGLILPIGLWVLQNACAQLKLWQQDPLTSELILAVNVSAKQFHQPGFVGQVQRVLLESGAKPARLKLELTESMLLENVDDIISKMRELKLLGVHFSMDDFGTGYSSLQYIKRLPLDQLKIDQSFVRDIGEDTNDAAIVQTIIAMSEALGLNVIAEGVETEAQREFLEKRGCRAFQGYLFSKPVPVGQFEALLKAGCELLPS